MCLVPWGGGRNQWRDGTWRHASAHWGHAGRLCVGLFLASGLWLSGGGAQLLRVARVWRSSRAGVLPWTYVRGGRTLVTLVSYCTVPCVLSYPTLRYPILVASTTVSCHGSAGRTGVLVWGLALLASPAYPAGALAAYRARFNLRGAFRSGPPRTWVALDSGPYSDPSSRGQPTSKVPRC